MTVKIDALALITWDEGVLTEQWTHSLGCGELSTSHAEPTFHLKALLCLEL